MADNHSKGSPLPSDSSLTKNDKEQRGASVLTTEQWNRLHSQLKQHWGQLNDQDVLATQGDFAQLTTLIQQQTGESRAPIEAKLRQLVDREPESEGSAGAGSVSR